MDAISVTEISIVGRLLRNEKLKANQRNEIGKTKLVNADIPVEENHSFGYEKKKDSEGVKEIARSWDYH